MRRAGGGRQKPLPGANMKPKRGFELGAALGNRTPDLRITSASLCPTELRRRAVLADGAWQVYRFFWAAWIMDYRTQGTIGQVRLTEEEARTRLTGARVARLATV